MENPRLYRHMLDRLRLFEKKKMDFNSFFQDILSLARMLNPSELRGAEVLKTIEDFEYRIDRGVYDKDFKGFETIKKFLLELEPLATPDDNCPRPN